MPTAADTTIDSSAWYTTRQVAAFLGCGEWSIRERLKRQIIVGRQLPAIGGGSPRWRVQGVEVLRLIGETVLGDQPQERRQSFESRQAKAWKRLGLTGKKGQKKAG